MQCRAFFVGGYSKLELDQKIDAAKSNPLLPEDVKEGRPPNGAKLSVDNVNTSKGGNDTDYTLRRLARDQPELLDEIKSGALSVNAAAIKAGIRKKLSHAEKCVSDFGPAPILAVRNSYHQVLHRRRDRRSCGTKSRAGTEGN